MAGKYGTNMDMGRGGTPGRTIFTKVMSVPLEGVAHLGLCWGCGKGGITVDGELACPAAPYPKCVAADTCQGSGLGEGC